MNLEDVKKELKERNLGVFEYFGMAFKVFKIFCKQNMGLIISGIIILFFSLFLSFVSKFIRREVIYTGNYLFYMYLVVIGIIKLIVAFVWLLFTAYFFRKVVYKIEGKKKLNLGKLFAKVSILGVILLGSGIFYSIMGYMIGRIAYIGTVITYLWGFLYFEAFYIRDMKIKESLSYIIRLARGNRHKKIITVLIMVIGYIAFVIIAAFIFVYIYGTIGNKETLQLLLLITFLTATSVAGIYLKFLNIVIFLNVEYNYLKKQNKNLKGSE